jgi:uncharacterized membrane protein YfcA
MALLEYFTEHPATTLWLAAAVFVLAGIVKGVVGLGLPTIAMALLASLMPPAQAAALLVVPSLVTNLAQIRPWRTLAPMLRRLAPMQAGVCAGTLVGAWLLGAPAGAWAMASLGVALVAYAAWGLAGAHFSVQPATEKWLGPLIGAATGLVTAATGVFVVPAVPYLQALGLSRDELVQAMGISFTVSTLALALGLYANAGGAGVDAAAGAGGHGGGAGAAAEVVAGVVSAVFSGVPGAAGGAHGGAGIDLKIGQVTLLAIPYSA